MRVADIINEIISNTGASAPQGIVSSFYQLSQKYPFGEYMESADRLMIGMVDYKQLCKEMQHLYH